MDRRRTCRTSSAGHRGGEARFDGPEVRAWSRALYDGGWVGITWPEAYGGRGLLAAVPGDLPRGGGARRGAAARRRDRPRDGRADDHLARHRRAEGALPAAAALGRGDLVPGILRARRRIRPRRRAHLGATRRRPVRRRRPEGVVVVRAHRGLLHPRRALRPGLGASRRPDVPDRRHARARGRGAPAPPDHRRGGVQRDLPERRRGARRERDRRDRRRLGRRDDDASPRARHAGFRARRAARGAGAEARRARRRPRRDAAPARGDRPRVDPAPGASRDGVPLALRPRADGHPRAGRVDPQAAVVGGEPARDEARPRAARPGRPASRTECAVRRVLAGAAAPQPRQHDRGGHVGDPPQHRRRARARPPEVEVRMDLAFTPLQDELRDAGARVPRGDSRPDAGRSSQSSAGRAPRWPRSTAAPG